MSEDKKPTWERARIKTKYAEIVRKVAAIRDEPFIDALYHIIDFYWQYQRGNIASNQNISVTKPDSEPKTVTSISSDEIELDEFE